MLLATAVHHFDHLPCGLIQSIRKWLLPHVYFVSCSGLRNQFGASYCSRSGTICLLENLFPRGQCVLLVRKAACTIFVQNLSDSTILSVMIDLNLLFLISELRHIQSSNVPSCHLSGGSRLKVQCWLGLHIRIVLLMYHLLLYFFLFSARLRCVVPTCEQPPTPLVHQLDAPGAGLPLARVGLDMIEVGLVDCNHEHVADKQVAEQPGDP